MKTVQLLVRVRIDDDERSDLDILRDMSGFLKEAVRKNVRQLDDRDPMKRVESIELHNGVVIKQ